MTYCLHQMQKWKMYGFFTNAEIILGIDDGSRGSTQTSAVFPQIVERGHPLDMGEGYHVITRKA